MGELRRGLALGALLIMLAGCGASSDGMAPQEPKDQPQSAQQPNPPEG